MDRFLFRKIIVLSFLLSMGIALFTACSNEEENNYMNSKKKIENSRLVGPCNVECVDKKK